jgi:hypothetical protein
MNSVMRPVPQPGGLAPAGSVRAFEADDAPAVARLFLRVFRSVDHAPPEDLVRFFRSVFVAALKPGQPSASRVFVEADGRLTGFVGVLPDRFLIDGRQVDVAVVGSLMVESPDRNPLAGARLVRAVAGGGQSLTLSETANPISQRLWEKMGAEAIPGYSLEFLRVIRPAGFAVEVLRRKVKAARFLHPIARLADRLAARLVADGVGPDTHHTDREVALGEAADLLLLLTADRRMRPDWDRAEVLRRLEEAAPKDLLGTFVHRALFDRREIPVGLYLYHVRHQGIAQVLNLVARPGHEAELVARLIDDATARGAVAIKGRAEPAVTNAFGARNTVFVHRASLIVHGRDRSLFEPLRSGDALATGLAAEIWIRLIGTTFI